MATEPTRWHCCAACMVTLTKDETCAFCDEGADLFADLASDAEAA